MAIIFCSVLFFPVFIQISSCEAVMREKEQKITSLIQKLEEEKLEVKVD